MQLKATPLSAGVAVILYRGGQFCISQRRRGLSYAGVFQFPTGHVEPGETPLAGACRELFEETGMRVDPCRLRFLGDEIITPGPRKGLAAPSRGFLVRLAAALGFLPKRDRSYRAYRYALVLSVGEEPQNTEPAKHTDWQWVDVAALPKKMMPRTRDYALSFAAAALSAAP